MVFASVVRFKAERVVVETGPTAIARSTARVQINCASPDQLRRSYQPRKSKSAPRIQLNCASPDQLREPSLDELVSPTLNTMFQDVLEKKQSSSARCSIVASRQPTSQKGRGAVSNSRD